MDILRLVHIGFDSLENHNARYEETIGIFTNDEDSHTSALGSLENWLKEQPPVKLHVGYDSQIYPQWRIIRDKQLNIVKTNKE